MSQSQARKVDLLLDIGCADGVEVPLPEAWLQRVAEAALAATGVAGEVEVALLLANDTTLHALA